MSKFRELLNKVLETNEDSNLQSDLATVNVSMNLNKDRTDDYKKKLGIYRICSSCGHHIMKSKGRYGNYCPMCSDPITKKDVEVFESEDKNVKGDKEAYQKYYQKILKKYGVKSPAELDDKKKKQFFDEIDAGWDAGENETDKD